jgi:hypothetical protein
MKTKNVSYSHATKLYCPSNQKGRRLACTSVHSAASPTCITYHHHTFAQDTSLFSPSPTSFSHRRKLFTTSTIVRYCGQDTPTTYDVQHHHNPTRQEQPSWSAPHQSPFTAAQNHTIHCIHSSCPHRPELSPQITKWDFSTPVSKSLITQAP